ncbi:MAG TPA: Hsp20/alpha crystallin family protein [Nitrospirota bacterium]|nr:Hsp20/alpha crystallin family protein [Nitrospirota bacterium]
MKSLIRWDPFRMMRHENPFEELRSMQREMDRLFDRFWGGESRTERPMLLMPSVESYTKDNKLVFKVELPGVDPKDLDVSITDRELIVKGERKSEKGAKEENYAYQEITYGSFERRFVLPEGVKTEELKAKFSNGILEITLPAPAIAKARKIEIEAPKEEKKLIETEAKKAA